MTDTGPGTSVPGGVAPPPRAPGPVPAGFVPRQWAESYPAPPRRPAGAPATTGPVLDGPFLNSTLAAPRTKKEAWRWLLYAVAGFLVGQLGAVIFGEVSGVIAGKTSAQMSTIVSASVPPEWYVVSTLLGIWVGFFGAPWLASRTQGTRHLLRDFGVRFKWIDLLGLVIGAGGQLLVSLMYLPFQHDIHDFNGPSQKLTGGSHGLGFLVIALATVALAPAMEELFFRGLLFRALARLFTPTGGSKGTARTAGVVLAVIADGLLFGLAHGEWVQLAGLAVFGMILAAVSYRTGRLGMNMVSHATFNLVALVAILHTRGGVIL
jgi:membrane protease YdiL (CAAX protease family)